MTDPDFTIRLATSADREAITRLFDTANPAWATSAAQYRAGPRPEPTNGLAVVAEDDSRIVGAGRANEALEGLLPQPGTFSARVAVDPNLLGRGVGSRVWNALKEWLDPQPVKEVLSWADRDDDRTVAIATHWRFTRRPGSIEDPSDLDDGEPWAWNYELDLKEHPGAEPIRVPADVTISPLHEILQDPTLAASLHEAHEESRADVPAWETYEPRPLAAFVASQNERLDDGGLGIVAHRNDEVLAATFAERAAFVPMVHNDFTMVRRSARGQCLGLSVKNLLITQAAAVGFERITTEVRTDNHPMQAINAALGFRRIAMRQLSRRGFGRSYG